MRCTSRGHLMMLEWNRLALTLLWHAQMLEDKLLSLNVTQLSTPRFSAALERQNGNARKERPKQMEDGKLLAGGPDDGGSSLECGIPAPDWCTPLNPS